MITLRFKVLLNSILIQSALSSPTTRVLHTHTSLYIPFHKHPCSTSMNPKPYAQINCYISVGFVYICSFYIKCLCLSSGGGGWNLPPAEKYQCIRSTGIDEKGIWPSLLWGGPELYPSQNTGARHLKRLCMLLLKCFLYPPWGLET